MSETWTSLLSGVVGAVVGGTFSLFGTRLAIKHQMATNARWRLYDELLPRLTDFVDALIEPQVPEDELAEEATPELLERVRRTSAIAGRLERKDADNLWQLWEEHRAELEAEAEAEKEARKTWGPPVAVNAEPDPPPGYKPPPSPAQLRLRRISDEIRAFSDKLGAKLG